MNKHIDLVLTLKDFYVIHAALRLFANNIHFIKTDILELSEQATDVEDDIEALAAKIDENIVKLTEPTARIQ